LFLCDDQAGDPDLLSRPQSHRLMTVLDQSGLRPRRVSGSGKSGSWRIRSRVRVDTHPTRDSYDSIPARAECFLG